MPRLNGKTVLLTGAAQGLGRAMATLFAAEGAGVALVDINGEALAEVEAEVTAGGGKAVAIHADLSQRAAAATAVAAAESALGPVDVLVNNAVWARYQAIADLDEETVDRMLAIGVKAILWLVQAVAPGMTARRQGSIVNISSISGLTGLAYCPTYAAVKGGVNALTRALAVDLGQQGIRVNALAPSAIPTPMSRRILGEEGWEGRRRRTPLGRVGEPEDVAQAALFLASDESRFVTGEVIRIDGGFCIGGAIPGVDVALR